LGDLVDVLETIEKQWPALAIHDLLGAVILAAAQRHDLTEIKSAGTA
jgi:hypothetical protein